MWPEWRLAGLVWSFYANRFYSWLASSVYIKVCNYCCKSASSNAINFILRITRYCISISFHRGLLGLLNSGKLPIIVTCSCKLKEHNILYYQWSILYYSMCINLGNEDLSLRVRHTDNSWSLWSLRHFFQTMYDFDHVLMYHQFIYDRSGWVEKILGCNS